MGRYITMVSAWIATRVDLRGARGATAIEYAVVASAIAALVVLAVALLGTATDSNIACAEESWRTLTESC